MKKLRAWLRIVWMMYVTLTWFGSVGILKETPDINQIFIVLLVCAAAIFVGLPD